MAKIAFTWLRTVWIESEVLRGVSQVDSFDQESSQLVLALRQPVDGEVDAAQIGPRRRLDQNRGVVLSDRELAARATTQRPSAIRIRTFGGRSDGRQTCYSQVCLRPRRRLV